MVQFRAIRTLTDQREGLRLELADLPLSFIITRADSAIVELLVTSMICQLQTVLVLEPNSIYLHVRIMEMLCAQLASHGNKSSEKKHCVYSLPVGNYEFMTRSNGL